MALSYVLPIRRSGGPPPDELTGYLRGLVEDGLDVLVVDNSDPDVWKLDDLAWTTIGVRHVSPDADLDGRYPKVTNVITGVRRAAHDLVIVADDDVRWDRGTRARAAALLAAGADLVVPQNVFEPLPWHARWDTARTLVNRALGGDFPGTLVLRRSTFLRVGGYDADCLFENLELMRTIRAGGGRVVRAHDLYVRRLPPTARHFWSQRVRQAYDELALPVRLVVWLAIVPGVARLVARRRWHALAAVTSGAVAAAEVGRRRAGGAARFPVTSSLLAPLWLLERGVAVWLALWSRLRHGGVRYAGGVLSVAAHSERTLRRRLSG